jgi:hypothetical protein
MTKHKHADLIHAWADGAEIECKNGNDGCWYEWNSSFSPPWHPHSEYRIKPEEKKPVVRWLWADKNESIYWLPSQVFATEQEAAMNKHQLVKLEWSRTEFPE